MGSPASCLPPARDAPAVYRPRRPERTSIYRLVRDRFVEFALVHEDRFEARDGPLRPVVRRVVEGYLDCGLLDDADFRLMPRSSGTAL